VTKTLSALVLALAACSLEAPEHPRVTTTLGTVEGRTVGPVQEFLAMPFEAPPLGELRWRAPSPAEPVVRRATLAEGHLRLVVLRAAHALL
jgi:carboxylesterase family protein